MTAKEKADQIVRAYTRHHNPPDGYQGYFREYITKAITEAVAEMQERCAKVADEHKCQAVKVGPNTTGCYCREHISFAIREVKP